MNGTSQSCGCESGLIDVIGLCAPGSATQVIRNAPYWKQTRITETLQIPEEKPDIEVVNSVEVWVDILRRQVIRTPRSYTAAGVPLPSLEGKLLSGRKLIIEGQLCQKVVYTALEPSQPLHSAHFYVPFSSFIVVPEEVAFPAAGGGSVTEDSCNVSFDVSCCVEDVAVRALDARSVLKQVTLMLYAVPTRTAC